MFSGNLGIFFPAFRDHESSFINALGDWPRPLIKFAINCTRQIAVHLYEPCHATLVSGVRVYMGGSRISGKGVYISLRPNYFIFIGYIQTGRGFERTS